ncbi:MAG: hypothetical protein IJW87_01150 [Clostridia bacterium]|nr:hypothetical protein [Clostridia bacterium]
MKNSKKLPWYHPIFPNLKDSEHSDLAFNGANPFRATSFHADRSQAKGIFAPSDLLSAEDRSLFMLVYRKSHFFIAFLYLTYLSYHNFFYFATEFLKF